MLCKCHWIVLYTVHFRPTAFCLGGPFFPRHGVVVMVTIGLIGSRCNHVAAPVSASKQHLPQYKLFYHRNMSPSHHTVGLRAGSQDAGSH